MTTPETFPANVFREYDIRGDSERDLSDNGARLLGQAIGTFLHRKGQHRIALGRDCRLSSPRLCAAIREGLLLSGATVIDIGVVPTPMMYFTVFHRDLDGGVQVTGSHNPPNDNGFKMMTGKDSLFGADIQTLREMIDKNDLDRRSGGHVEEYLPIDAYCDTVAKTIRLGRTQVRCAIDAGNGAGGPTALAAFRALGLEPEALLCDMDGRFPVHHPDPTQPKNMELLIRRVRDNKLEVGLALDGDADRLGVVDSEGNILWGDQLMVIFARSILQKNPGAAIIGEVKCSQTLFDDIEKHGGRPVLWKTGHSLIKKKMKEEGALLAGEMSGHLFFADRYFGYDDAVYASLRLLEIISSSKQTLTEMLADLPKTYSTPELRVDCADDQKFGIVKRVAEHFKKTNKVVDIDGARILFDGGWGLVRASNTQPVLVMRFEANSDARLDAIRNEVEAVVRSAS